MLTRRVFLQGLGGSLALAAKCQLGHAQVSQQPRQITRPRQDEDVFAFLMRTQGSFDTGTFSRILGAANEFKEGDQLIGVAAVDEQSRRHARTLLLNTRLADIDAHAVHQDRLYRFIQPTSGEHALSGGTFADLKNFLLDAEQPQIQQVMTSLSSDVIGCVVRLFTNDQLISVGRRIFNPLPGSQIGSQGYLGARVQPNSPTDNVDDIRWQVFNAWSFAVGDVLLGTNPVSSDPQSVAAIERALQDLLVTFEIDHLMPHCVLSHIDVQSEVEAAEAGITELWFQSIAGCDEANQTFDISVDKMVKYADGRGGTIRPVFRNRTRG